MNTETSTWKSVAMGLLVAMMLAAVFVAIQLRRTGSPPPYAAAPATSPPTATGATIDSARDRRSAADRHAPPAQPDASAAAHGVAAAPQAMPSYEDDAGQDPTAATRELLNDPDPQVRSAAAALLDAQAQERLIDGG